MLTLPLLLIIFFTHIPFNSNGPGYPNQQRLTMLYQLYIFTWLLLVIGTALLHNLQIGGTYFLSGWYIFTFLGAVAGSTERILRRRKLARSQKSPTPSRTNSLEEHGLQEQPILHSSSSHTPPARDEDTDPVRKPKPHERTPLITRKPPSEHQQEIGSTGWWILQALLLIVVPVILISHILILYLAALSQTLSDGSSPIVGK